MTSWILGITGFTAPHSENHCPEETLVHKCQETRTRLFTGATVCKSKRRLDRFIDTMARQCGRFI